MSILPYLVTKHFSVQNFHIFITFIKFNPPVLGTFSMFMPLINIAQFYFERNSYQFAVSKHLIRSEVNHN